MSPRGVPVPLTAWNRRSATRPRTDAAISANVGIGCCGEPTRPGTRESPATHRPERYRAPLPRANAPSAPIVRHLTRNVNPQLRRVEGGAARPRRRIESAHLSVLGQRRRCSARHQPDQESDGAHEDARRDGGARRWGATVPHARCTSLSSTLDRSIIVGTVDLVGSSCPTLAAVGASPKWRNVATPRGHSESRPPTTAS